MDTARKINNHINSIICSINKVHLSSWKRGLAEVLAVLALYAAYTLTQGVLTNKEAIAVQNSYDLINFEKYLRIFWELNIQAWFLKSVYLVHFANAVYTYLFYPSIIGFAAWTYNRHQPRYQTARNVFLASTAFGLVCFAFFPAAPPRLMPWLGFVDTMSLYEPVNYRSEAPSVFVNLYAAMPSFHFGWTLLVGASTFFIARTAWLKALGIALPVLMFISIIATGNHFILDAVAGGLIMLLAYGLVKLFAGFWSKYTVWSCRNN